MIDERLPNVSYHVRALQSSAASSSCARRSAAARSSTTTARCSGRSSATATGSGCRARRRQAVTDVGLQMIWEDASEAIEAGTFESRSDRHLSRTPAGAGRTGLARAQRRCSAKVLGQAEGIAAREREAAGEVRGGRDPDAPGDDALRDAGAELELVLEQPAQAPARAVQAHLDGALGEAESASHLDLGQVLRVAQAQHALVAVRQRPKRLLDRHPVAAPASSSSSRGAAPRSAPAARDAPGDRAAARLVASDLEHPGQRRVGVAACVPAQPGPHQAPPGRPPPRPPAAAPHRLADAARSQPGPVPGAR